MFPAYHCQPEKFCHMLLTWRSSPYLQGYFKFILKRSISPLKGKPWVFRIEDISSSMTIGPALTVQWFN